ncbi:hypothetical protein [Olivibacter sitiensis]|uniref:hypothetical protein n=1 Tax=Olivibacter sitiensis TaxID=376470 RepID=UPI00041F3285|nr:hypothetical protein [Olivibacter sitiensis]
MKSRLLKGIIAIALIWSAGNALAQEKVKTTSQTPTKTQMTDLATKLDLSAKQSTSYQKILTEHDSQVNAAKQKYGESSTKGKQKIAELEAKKETKIKKLLGNEKYVTYLKESERTNTPSGSKK